MSLTTGSAPFGHSPAGVFGAGVQLPEHVMYFEPSPRRIRLVLDDVTVADSRNAHLLYESRALPSYYLPQPDVRMDLLEPSLSEITSPSRGKAQAWTLRIGNRVVADAALSYPKPPAAAPPITDYLTFRWDAVDAWYEEDEEIFVHPADPYHRIDIRQSSRHVRVLVDGTVIAESRRPVLLFETGLPTRYYLPSEDVRTDLLVESGTSTACAYKGTASYWSVRLGEDIKPDLIWSYVDPEPESARIGGYLAFFNERVDIEVDGELETRPQIPWSQRARVPMPAAD